MATSQCESDMHMLSEVEQCQIALNVLYAAAELRCNASLNCPDLIDDVICKPQARISNSDARIYFTQIRLE